jgi:hypothetical protein
VSLFADSSFMFLANVEYVIVFDVIYQFEWMNIILFLSKKIDVVYGMEACWAKRYRLIGSKTGWCCTAQHNI